MCKVCANFMFLFVKNLNFCPNWFGIICLKFLVNVQICANSMQNYDLRKDNRANSSQTDCKFVRTVHLLNVLYVALFYLCLQYMQYMS